MLSPAFKKRYQHIPWNNIIEMRHVLVHGYATILPQILWQTALVDVPLLKKQIEDLQKEIRLKSRHNSGDE